ncbi:DUF692 domain-containing protein [Streptomyces sp. SKN60]|uniref:DUF692 domain-containing protein n=1 Tax=Streptomyces sp. SKN60 TaxID=2855506 RepID=UPI00224648FC|nr:DUF692 domain-containing protein [Streptomyces sp. SKN60]MCX2185147.1 DUF692 domain-containing protein [Streptomyces sp. SKN60]
MKKLGVGIGWRPEIAEAVEALAGVDWVEVVAENICADHLPDSLVRLMGRGVTVVPHGVSLGLGGADRPDAGRLDALARKAEALGAPLVTEHIAFVRAGGPLTATPLLEAGHLLPVPRTWDALDVLCENVRIAQDALPVPLALENIAALVAWPGEELTEGQFLAELVERTGVRLLIDVANLHTNHVNRGEDPAEALSALPVESLAYVHVAGGLERDGVWHDTHAHPVSPAVLDVLADLASRVTPPGVLLERDDRFPAPEELAAELAAIRTTVETARPRPLLIGAGARASGGAMPVAPVPVRTPAPVPPPRTVDAAAARQRVGLAEAALLSALVAGTPAPEGFDVKRLGVQSRALAAKRADVVAKVAPELPEILGEEYRPAFLAYARKRPMTDGYRHDALDFVETLLVAGRPEDPAARTRLTAWWRERADIRPPGPAARVLHRIRTALGRGEKE